MSFDNKKIGTELNLALNTSEEERIKTLDLDTGYDRNFNEWELIIRYTGNIATIAEEVGFTYIELLNNYGIIRINESDIEYLSQYKDIIFIEKPKKIYTERVGRIDGFTQSCMDFVVEEPLNLTGKGIIVSVIDSGIDIFHPEFRDNDTTKIYEIWDQSVDGNPPAGYKKGTIFSKDDINIALKNNDRNFMSADFSGHGTGVASVITGCVPDSNLLVIKLDTSSNGGFPSTTSLMLAIDYSVRKSIDEKIPMVINLSFGNNYGDHDANSIVEEYIDSVATLSKISIVTGMGNEGSSSRHVDFNLNEEEKRVEFIVDEFETGINIQVWKGYQEDVQIYLITPSYEMLGPFDLAQDIMKYSINQNLVSVINGYPTPINRNQETYITISPVDTYIDAGIWTLLFINNNKSGGRVDIWLPVSGSTTSDVRFVNPSVDTTMTIPSTADKIISVGAYDQNSLTYAAFSGRGYTTTENVKPDISAPGVNIDVALVGGGYTYMSGTSFACPFVSSAAAMLMQWGIIDENDVYLYGEKLKSYLIRGAYKLPGYSVWPNEKIGWGALCVRDSIPI